MEPITELHARRGRARPSHVAWAKAMNALADRHEAHAWLPFHLLEAVGDTLGVAARSVETQYGHYLAALEASTPWRLAAEDLATVATAVDFVDAYALLQAAGAVPAFAVVERALWADVSRTLVGLRVAERRRRQRLAEADECPNCAVLSADAAA